MLTTASRDYVLGLMARVVSYERWGVPAGAPTDVTVHVKNGWLPQPTHGWRINSIGSFSGHGKDYMIVVLTDDNPTMAYGVEHRAGHRRGDQPGAEPRRDVGHPGRHAEPLVGPARRADPRRRQGALEHHRTTPGPTARATFPDWRFAPNIGGHPDIYEIENRALDPGGHVLAAMRRLAPWDGRTLVDLGCGTGFWLPGYARDAARVIGVEPDPALRARAAARIRGLPDGEVLPGSAEHLPLADRSVDVVHARFAYFLAPGSPEPGAGGDAGLAEVCGCWRPGGSLIVVDNDYRWGEFAGLLAAASPQPPQHTADDRRQLVAASAAPPGTRSGRSGSSPAARTSPRCWTSRSRPAVARAWLARHPAATGLSCRLRPLRGHPRASVYDPLPCPVGIGALGWLWVGQRRSALTDGPPRASQAETRSLCLSSLRRLAREAGG